MSLPHCPLLVSPPSQGAGEGGAGPASQTLSRSSSFPLCLSETSRSQQRLFFTKLQSPPLLATCLHHPGVETQGNV